LEKGYEWTSIKFSNDGKFILISTKGSEFYLMDSFDGILKNTFSTHSYGYNEFVEASFTPDAKYVFCGSSDGKVHFWNLQTGIKEAEIDSFNPSLIHMSKFNPRYLMMATCANSELVRKNVYFLRMLVPRLGQVMPLRF
jgi:COMPASS component SWD2